MDQKTLTIYTERQAMTRVVLQVLVAWFTFFLTSHVVTYGWLAEVLADSGGFSSLHWGFVAFFIIQDIIALGFLWWMGRWATRSDPALGDLGESAADATGGLLRVVLSAMTCTIVTTLAFWIAIVFLV